VRNRSAQFLAERAAAEREMCEFCHAPPGDPCRNAKNGEPVQFQTAHAVRVQLALERAAEEPA